MLNAAHSIDDLPPRVEAFPEYTEAKRFKGLCHSALLSLNASQLVPHDYKDPLEHAGASMEVYDVQCSPAILAAAWEHVLLYGDPSKINAQALGSDSPQREWAAKKLERPADAFIAKLQAGQVPEDRETRLTMAQDVIADENARFDRKVTLARFIQQHAPNMPKVLARLDEVMFAGALGQGNGQSLQLVSEDECAVQRTAMETRVWHAIDVAPVVTLSTDREVASGKDCSHAL